MSQEFDIYRELWDYCDDNSRRIDNRDPFMPQPDMEDDDLHYGETPPPLVEENFPIYIEKPPKVKVREVPPEPQRKTIPETVTITDLVSPENIFKFMVERDK